MTTVIGKKCISGYEIEVGAIYETKNHGLVKVTGEVRRIAGGYVCDVEQEIWSGQLVTWAEPVQNLFRQS